MARLDAFFRRLNPRERTIFFSVVIVISLLAGKSFIWDEAMGIFDVWTRTQTVERDIARNRTILQDLLEARPESLRVSPYWTYRQENSGLGNLIRRVSSNTETRRFFTVRKIAVEKTEKLPEYDKTKFEVEVEGPFQSVGDFLEDLENSRFLTRVESVQVYRIERELRLCRAKIILNSFSWRDL